jgi:hypothetical protein
VHFQAVELDAFSPQEKFDAVIGLLRPPRCGGCAAICVAAAASPSRKLRCRSRAACPTRRMSANVPSGY